MLQCYLNFNLGTYDKFTETKAAGMMDWTKKGEIMNSEQQPTLHDGGPRISVVSPPTLTFDLEVVAC